MARLGHYGRIAPHRELFKTPGHNHGEHGHMRPSRTPSDRALPGGFETFDFHTAHVNIPYAFLSLFNRLSESSRAPTSGTPT